MNDQDCKLLYKYIYDQELIFGIAIHKLNLQDVTLVRFAGFGVCFGHRLVNIVFHSQTVSVGYIKIFSVTHDNFMLYCRNRCV